MWGLHEGAGDYLKYLKRGWNRKEGRGNKDFKKGGKLGQGMGVLKTVGLEPPSGLCGYSIGDGVDDTNGVVVLILGMTRPKLVAVTIKLVMMALVTMVVVLILMTMIGIEIMLIMIGIMLLMEIKMMVMAMMPMLVVMMKELVVMMKELIMLMIMLKMW